MASHDKRVLFILKRRDAPYELQVPGDRSDWGDYSLSSGLLNSATLLSQMLNDIGYASRVVQVNDNNDIDREVFLFNADVCVIEAFWVVPEKFDELKLARPNCRFLVRNHSELPFLSQDGIAIEWIISYIQHGVYVACNTQRNRDEFQRIATAFGFTDDKIDNIVYLPNFYPISFCGNPDLLKDSIDIGCFGAVRPLKNQLIQAVAAIEWAAENNKILNFHINGGRLEMGGLPIIKNLRALFDPDNTHGKYNLVEHPWTQHDEFKDLMSTMDLSMQVAFSETFNIVTADAITSGVPIVVSPDIYWVDPDFMADPTDSVDIKNTIKKAIDANLLGVVRNIDRLERYDIASINQWTQVLNKI